MYPRPHHQHDHHQFDRYYREENRFITSQYTTHPKLTATGKDDANGSTKPFLRHWGPISYLSVDGQKDTLVNLTESGISLQFD
jgi:hypothetical protein